MCHSALSSPSVRIEEEVKLRSGVDTRLGLMSWVYPVSDQSGNTNTYGGAGMLKRRSWGMENASNEKGGMCLLAGSPAALSSQKVGTFAGFLATTWLTMPITSEPSSPWLSLGGMVPRR